MSNRKINKVLLITPPAFTFKDMRDINPTPPLGLGYIASVLEKAGIEIKIFDSLIENLEREEKISEDIIRIGSSFEKIERAVREFAPGLVGVSNLFSRQAENARKVYEVIKKVNPNIIVVAGGAHPTVMPGEVMKDKNVDYVIIGEGEITFSDLIQYLENKKDINELDGIAFRKESSVKIIPKKKFIPNLDSIPFPARHLLHMEKYFGLQASHGARKSKRFSPIVTSRGCPIGCTFCTAHHVWGRAFRKRSPENVIKEMKEIKDQYGVEELLIEDDNLTLDVGRAEEIFDLMIKEKLDFKWDTPNGVAAFALTNELIKKMKDAGCYQLNIAVESGNQYVLKNVIKKPLDLEKIKLLVEFAKEIGLGVSIFLIIGMPGETIAEMWDSYRFAKDIGIYNPFVSVATPYPGSELYDLCVKKGYIPKDFPVDKMFIKSFSISTEDWRAGDVQRVFEEGYLYLQKYFYKKHPVLLSKKIIEKLSKDPIGFVKKSYMALKH